MERIKEQIAELQARFSALSQRERTMVTVAAVAVVVFGLFLVLYTSASSAASARRRTAQKVQKLEQAQQLAASFRQAEQARRNVERQLTGSDLQLISYLTDRGTEAGLEIPAMNPKGDVALGDGKIVESSVELTLTDVSISDLHQFLTSVERGPGLIKVKFLRIEPRPTNETVTAWVNIAAYKMRQ